jgi:two-component system sensor histidine kinase ChiS
MTGPARILVVEDEPVSRELLVKMLTTHGFEAESVDDGPACMHYLQGQTPDMILLDVSMPEMSGFELLKWIRQRHTAEQLPVILVSALIDTNYVISGLEAGGNDYVPKPVNLPVLLARIEVVLGMKQSVERLVEAERHREKLQALADACDHLGRPVQEVIGSLESLLKGLPESDDGDVRTQLQDILEWANQAGELLEKLQKVASYRKVPYTEGLGGLVSASLDEAMRKDA